MSRGVVYLGGPITGLTWDEAQRWRNRAGAQLARAGWKYLDPMRGEQEQFGFADDEQLPSTFAGDREACMRDLFDIDRATVCLFNFAGAQRVSVGSTTELGYAYAKDKYTVVVLDEANPHEHLFVVGLASAVVPSLEDALTLLRGL